jgi:hypothetical protein
MSSCRLLECLGNLLRNRPSTAFTKNNVVHSEGPWVYISVPIREIKTGIGITRSDVH